MKITRPKLKIKLSSFLAIVFVLIVLAEIWILFQYLYLDSPARYAPADQSVNLLRIDQEGVEDFRVRLSAREDYELPAYVLAGEAFGRENPFAEYPR